MIITSESVFSGHPDKVCDQISDAILDAILEQDKNARVAVETAIKGKEVYIFGEVTTCAKVNYKVIALRILIDIGYLDDFNVHINLTEQSIDIAIGVNERYNKEQGAGDQGMMYGYATDETEERLPVPLAYAHKIAKRFKALRKDKYFHIFGPDGKCDTNPNSWTK